MPIGPSDWRARNRSFTRESLEHTLAVAHFLVGLEVSSRLRAEVSIIPFEDIFLFGIRATLADPFAIDLEDTAGHRVRLLPSY